MPTSRRPPAGIACNACNVAAIRESVRSAQPTTPATNSVRAAISRNSRVSSRLERVCTRTVRSTPHSASRGRRSSGPNRRRITARSAVIHGYSAAPGSQKCWWASTTGGSGTPPLRFWSRDALGNEPLPPEVFPEGGGDLVPEQAHVLLDLRRRSAPGQDGRDRPMPQWELDRRRREGDAVAAAGRLEALGAADEVGRGGDVVEGRAGAGIGQNAAVVDAPRDDRDVSRHAQGQQFPERRLVQQRVAPRQQEAVH